jgi:phage terminase large subunit-like protein
MSLELLDELLAFSKPHRLSVEKMAEAAQLAEELKKREKQNRIDMFYPDLANRRQYPVHMRFFQLGTQYRERLFMAANRVGKTEGAILYETVLHATGEYPEWWQGRRFQHAVECWVGGDTGTSVRDILQFKLLGKLGDFGTGLIRAELLAREPSSKRGISDAVETIYVKHKPTGDVSTIQLKTYEQGRIAWQGTSKHVVSFDEEVPEEIAEEGMLRTMDCDGIVMYGYTPLNGMTEVTQKFLDEENSDLRTYVQASWDDVPHLTQEAKDAVLRLSKIQQRNARSKGIPTQGAGSVYPIEADRLECEPFPLPKHWPRGYGMDVGWNRTAGLFGALDRESDILYVYSEHYEGEEVPSIHADAIKRRGRMVGYIDPAARGRSQVDGEQLLQTYRNLGLMLQIANNAVESGVYEVWQRAVEGRLRIFRNCRNVLREWSMYHRDKNGKIVKKNDHALDALRYLIMDVQHIGYTTDHTNYAYTPSGIRYVSSLPSNRVYRGNR